MNKVVVSLSIGTAMLFIGLVGACCLTIVAMNIEAPKADHHVPYKPKAGMIGEVERQVNELKYGPVNLDAAKEIKNGLFDRLRVRRAVQTTSHPFVSHANSFISYPVSQSYCIAPQQAVCNQSITIDPTDCNYSYVVASNPTATIVSKNTGVNEYPSSNPLDSVEANCNCSNPLEESSEAEQIIAKQSSRQAVKTGSFICSNCRAAKVGDWHTDWRSDGTPITFLCEPCYQRMSHEQRIAAYKGYVSRQTKSVGKSGLLHQEIGK